MSHDDTPLATAEAEIRRLRAQVARLAEANAAIIPGAPALVYVAAPYRGLTGWDVEQNIRRAEALAAEVAKLGAYPVTPHACTRGYFESFQPGEFWLRATLALLSRCDAAIFSDDWERSTGARGELDWCVANGLPYFDQPGVGSLMALRHWLAGWGKPVSA